MGSCQLLDINIHFSHGHRSVQVKLGSNYRGTIIRLQHHRNNFSSYFLVAIVLIVRARATERKAPFKLLQLASLIIFSSMVIIVVGIMFIPFTGKFQSVFYGTKFCSKSWGLPNYSLGPSGAAPPLQK